MAIKELFYDNRPRVLLDPRASQRIDPRFTFTRDSTGTYVDVNGIIQTAAVDEPRFDHNPETGESLGLLIEESRTNVVKYSTDLTDPVWYIERLTVSKETIQGPGGLIPYDKITLGVFGPPVGNTFLCQGKLRMSTATAFSSGTRITQSVYLKAGTCRYVYFSKQFRNSAGTGAYFDLQEGVAYGFVGAHIYSRSIEPAGNGWWYITMGVEELGPGGSDGFQIIPMTEANPGISTNGTRQYTANGETMYAYAPQTEAGSFSTSYIPTSGSVVTRDADLLSIEAPLPATGSVYIDASAIEVKENDTLLSLKNDSNDKIDLAYLSSTATYNSLALIANYDGTSKSSLPLPVPTTDRERNIITYGTNNYQYGRDSSRFAPSLSSSVPTGLNQLSIGHDAVDPTKAFNGYINTVYAWSGELTPEVAKALVRGEIDAINADTYSPTGPAGSLALVINTQGVGADGEKTFTLPAESVANDNDIVITWGDGTESGLDGAAAELGAVGLTHDYPAAGIYPVFVEEKLQNIKFNNSSSANDLLLIAAWGTGDMLTSPSTMNGAFYGCSQMDFSSSARTTNRPDTSAVTDWTSAFRDCSSITGTFPAFNFSAATSFTDAWRECSSMTSFVAAGDQTQNVTSFTRAWYNCNGLTSFPLINTSSGTNFGSAWYNCNSLTSFPLINTSSGTNFALAWSGCSSLTSFPLINTSSGTSFTYAWYNCNGLTSFPLLNTSSGTSFNQAWQNCTSLTSFPLLNTSSGTSFNRAWQNCSSLTSFPLLNTSISTSFYITWQNCSSLTSFPLLDTSSGISFFSAWLGCSSLTSFPLLDTSSGTDFGGAWRDCSSLTSFPLLDTSSGTNFALTWYGCSSLTSFPLLDTSSGTSFGSAWAYGTSLTSFPLIDTSSGTDFFRAWLNCTSLTDFPANFFDSWTGTPANQCFYQTWDGCSSLTATSVDNILVSIAASGVSAPSGTGTNDKKITIDYDGTTLPGTTATAITTLDSRNWEIYLNNVLQ